MGHLVAAPDKFRGTASAKEISAAAARGARDRGWTADEVPMADGGEGLLEALGGEPRRTRVTGPLGEAIEAEWRLADGRSGGEGRAVIEMAQAAGRQLLGTPSGDAPVRASTAGVGQLILAAVNGGARRVVVGCGGSATTDGGWGAVEVIGSAERLGGAELLIASDVTTMFVQAAVVFGPQKGASPEQVLLLTHRLGQLAERYREQFGVDVESISGSGAAGGLAGGLAALGGRIVPGFDLVAELVELPARLTSADLVVTGEGHLDPPSLRGKVVGGVITLVAKRAPVLCVVGDADPEVLRALPSSVEVVRLVALAGPERARRDTATLVQGVVADRLGRG